VAHRLTKNAIASAEDYGAALAPGARSPARYAASAIPSRGRRHQEPECASRSPYQRDRDRVIHSTAFRRLTHKTQVFIYHEGDHYRTRLTHSLEVAQIARTIARRLRLDEDLAEVIALAHDLGHPPFGHAGERALDAVMTHYGGFDHNAQSLRVVAELERKYLQFDGLNLSWETLEGLAKHNGPLPNPASSPVARAAEPIEAWLSLDLDRWPSAEAQVAAIADDIAYVCHDIDDGLRAGLLMLPALADAPLAKEAIEFGLASSAGADEARQIYEVTRRMITRLIEDIVQESRSRLRQLEPRSPNDIRAAPAAIVAFSAACDAEIAALKRYLFARVYRHDRVMRVMGDAERVVRDLFGRYMESIETLPEAWRNTAARLDGRRRARHIADFVAGMTDRYAMDQHRRLFDASPDLR